MKRRQLAFLIAVTGFSLGTAAGWAQVTPEIQLGARGIMSFNMDLAANQTASAVNDFSDTALLLGFRQKLYNAYRGQLVVGFQFLDANSDLGQVFYHQVFVKLESKSNILKMGRSRVRSALIEFPTLRDDDALHFTDVLNPFSSGDNTEDNQYGNVIEAAHVFRQRYWIRVHGEHFTETPERPGATEVDFSLNALGLSLQYVVPATQMWNRPLLQQIGIGLNNFLTERPGYGNVFDRALKNFTFSAIVNLRRDPVHFWDLRHQTIVNTGFSEVDRLSNFGSMARAKAIATFTSLRYLYRKLERPALQVSLAFGYKNFPGLASQASQVQIVANGFYRLGENFDLGLQYQLRRAAGDMRTLLGKSENRFQFTLTFAIDQLWNNQFDDRDSLLNLEHGYLR